MQNYSCIIVGVLCYVFEKSVCWIVNHVYVCIVPQVMFEKYQCAGVYIAIQAVLTLYAQGKLLQLWNLRSCDHHMTLVALIHAFLELANMIQFYTNDRYFVTITDMGLACHVECCYDNIGSFT